MPKKNSIPDRWLEYNPIGDALPGSSFVAMKVPLKKEISVPESDRFSCEDVLHHFEEKGLQLGLIIDLTYTSRYYNPQFFTSKSVDHCKILMPGHQIPAKHIVDTFKQKVTAFEKECAGTKKLIAVHCTHGVNRTGYLICRYLIEEKGLDPEEAISRFNQARGHAIERPVYLDNLRTLNASRQSQTISNRTHSKQNNESRSYNAPQLFSSPPWQQQRERYHHRGTADYRSRRFYNEKMAPPNYRQHSGSHGNWEDQRYYQRPHHNVCRDAYPETHYFDQCQTWSYQGDHYYRKYPSRPPYRKNFY